MSDVTRILSQIDQGDPHAAQELLPLVYDELRKLAALKLAQEKAGPTLPATALVHEAYLRLMGKSGDRQQGTGDTSEEPENANQSSDSCPLSPSGWNSRGHFFGAAAEAMRRILVNRARDKGRLKRGGQKQRLDLEQIEVATDAPDEDLLALDEAIERLAQENPECAR